MPRPALAQHTMHVCSTTFDAEAHHLQAPRVEKNGDVVFDAVAVDTKKTPNRKGFVFKWAKAEDVHVEAWEQNPVLLYYHSAGKLPIGSIERIKVSASAVTVRARIPDMSGDEAMRDFDRTVLAPLRAYVTKGLLRAVSIGFYIRDPEDVIDPKTGQRTHTLVKSLEIVELSLVDIGAHETALIKQGEQILEDALGTEAVKDAGAALAQRYGTGAWKSEAREGELIRLRVEPAEPPDVTAHKPDEPTSAEVSDPFADLATFEVEMSPDSTAADVADMCTRFAAEGHKVKALWRDGHHVAVISVETFLPAEPEGSEDTEREEQASWGAIPYARHGKTAKAPEDVPWDAGKETKAADVDALKVMCAFEDRENLDSKSAYKGPHHTAAGNKVVLRGVQALMGALLGARGGFAGVPKDVLKKGYAHASRHYDDFGREAPEYKQYAQSELLALHRAGQIIIPGVPEPDSEQGAPDIPRDEGESPAEQQAPQQTNPEVPRDALEAALSESIGNAVGQLCEHGGLRAYIRAQVTTLVKEYGQRKQQGSKKQWP